MKMFPMTVIDRSETIYTVDMSVELWRIVADTDVPRSIRDRIRFACRGLRDTASAVITLPSEDACIVARIVRSLE